MTTEEAIKQLKEYILGMNYMDDEAVWMAIKALEQQPCEDCIRELIREFDKKHPVFAYYMQEFNSHSISEIIEYMWDMHELIKDIKYRLPNEGGDDE